MTPAVGPDIHVFCDEPADRALFLQLRGCSKELMRIPEENVRVYGSYRDLGEAAKFLVELVREDRPDFILALKDRPFLVIELTEHGYTGDNPLQRFTRFAIAAEQKVPFVYFTPFSRIRDDELDLTDDPSTLSKRRVNTNVFLGMLRLSQLFDVPQLALDWPLADNGKPRKLGTSPTSSAICEVFGQLIEVLELFVGTLSVAAARGESVMGNREISALQEEVRRLTEVPNVRNSAVRLEVPADELIELAGNPRGLLEHITPQSYFFHDKPERLLAMFCLETALIEKVEVPDGSVQKAGDIRKQLAGVFKAPRFKRDGIAYYTGYKWRSDPHCGVLVNTDYIYCRPNGATSAAGRPMALVIFYPRVCMSEQSRAHRAVANGLAELRERGTRLYRLFEERYVDDNPEARRRRFSRKDAIGIWSDGTKQARIFRKYCDLIVLADAVLIGNHWKT